MNRAMSSSASLTSTGTVSTPFGGTGRRNLPTHQDQLRPAPALIVSAAVGPAQNPFVIGPSTGHARRDPAACFVADQEIGVVQQHHVLVLIPVQDDHRREPASHPDRKNDVFTRGDRPRRGVRHSVLVDDLLQSRPTNVRAAWAVKRPSSRSRAHLGSQAARGR
jgi:hypothetical protein